jgi:hypothetical protein
MAGCFLDLSRLRGTMIVPGTGALSRRLGKLTGSGTTSSVRFKPVGIESLRRVSGAPARIEAT